MKIEVIDLRLLVRGNPHELHRLQDALRNPGFFFLKNHGIKEGSIKNVLDLWKEFVFFTPNVREYYAHKETGYQIGYTPIGIEKGVGAQVADEKHFWHTRDANSLVVNQIPLFKESQDELFLEFDKLYKNLMGFVAKTLTLPFDYFEGHLGNSVLRSIHYPAALNPIKDDGEVNRSGNVQGICAYKHTDINLITLLLAREKGLQLLHENLWQEVTITEPDLIVVNCGDMLEHLTGGFYKSGVHRVVCEPGMERISVPFFGHPVPEFSLVPLAHLGGPSEKYPYKTAGAFLDARLQEINLKK